MQKTEIGNEAAAIALWFCFHHNLKLQNLSYAYPFYHPGFESHAHNEYFIQFTIIDAIETVGNRYWNEKRTKINEKEAGIGTYF